MIMTKHEIIDETVEYYSIDPKNRRGISKNGLTCVYYTETQGIIKMCAVGRCLIDPKVFASSLSSVSHVLKDNDQLLKEQYRGHPIKFWLDIQYLHDWNSYWDEVGLTEAGRYKVKELKETCIN